MPFDGLPRLGKKPASPPRVRPLAELLGLGKPSVIMPPVPTSVDRGRPVTSWPMLDNDSIGDCTIAAVGHAVQLWTTVAGDPRAMTGAEALLGYERFGYVPGDADTDLGANAQDVLARWADNGFACGGKNDRLAGFCSIAPKLRTTIKMGVAWLGVVYAGIRLPLGVQGADSWDLGPLGDVPAEGPWAPGSWGGHAVPIIGYDAKGLTVVTWGRTLRMSWRFWDGYADEAYGLLSRDFACRNVPAEAWRRLEDDMAGLRKAA
ncbi:MAG: hypothetical protein ACREFZ_00950 [Acetobacteraceae bacterium]